MSNERLPQVGPEVELLERYRRGDVGAMEELVRHYRKPLFGYILNMTGARQDADEIFQETWLRVIKRLSLYRQSNFFGWLVRIAHNIVIDRARRRKPVTSLEAEGEDGFSLGQVLADRDPGPRRRLESAHLGRHIAEAVARLPAEQRAVFLMRVESGLAFKEIARAQKVSINTALARMQYALQKLRTALQGHYDDLNGPTGL